MLGPDGLIGKFYQKYKQIKISTFRQPFQKKKEEETFSNFLNKFYFISFQYKVHWLDIYSL